MINGIRIAIGLGPFALTTGCGDWKMPPPAIVQIPSPPPSSCPTTTDDLRKLRRKRRVCISSNRPRLTVGIHLRISE
jgi:hypothetical protein